MCSVWHSLPLDSLVSFLQQSTVLQVCDGLVSRSCSDTSALHLVNLILKELRREHEITAVYLAASTAHPRDAELLEQLFGAYAR